MGSAEDARYHGRTPGSDDDKAQLDYRTTLAIVFLFALGSLVLAFDGCRWLDHGG